MRQGLHDDAGGKRQYLLWRYIELLCQRYAAGARAHQTICTRAGIGVAGVDEHGAYALREAAMQTQVFAANLYRGRTKTVLREDPAHHASFVEQQHRQILAAGLANSRLGDTPAHARHGKKFSCRRRKQVHGHGDLHPSRLSLALELDIQAGISAQKIRQSQLNLPWHILNFLPEPHGQGSLRPTRAKRLDASAWPCASRPEMTCTSPVSVGAM